MNDRDRKPKFRRGGGKGPDGKRDFGRRPAWRDREASPDGPVILYGWHTVAAALANPQRQIRKLLLTENAARRLAIFGRDNPARTKPVDGGHRRGLALTSRARFWERESGCPRNCKRRARVHTATGKLGRPDATG